MRVRPESVTHLVVKLFNVKSKFDYIDKNKQKSEIFHHETSNMDLSIIFLEDKHKILLHLSIFYEYQQFFQHRICFSIQPPDYSDPD